MPRKGDPCVAPADRLPPIVILTGPTAAGKSALALELAAAVGGEIVSADSMQVYRYLDIGTAKPTAAERRRVPHHLIDLVDPAEAYHVGRFREDAARAIAAVAGRGRVPLVVGGTALYLKVLTEGLAPGPGRDPEVRARLEARWDRGEAEALWRELQGADPPLARRLHPNDRTRVIRGLEVWLLTGRGLSEVQGEHGFRDRPYRALWLGVGGERGALADRIDRRVVRMMEAGWVEEVRRLVALGYGAETPGLQALGYRQLLAHLAGETSLDETVEAIQRETRRFAKRQMTWFRRWPLTWLAPEDAAGAGEAVRNFLQSPSLPV